MRSCESFSCPLPCKQSPSFFNRVTQLQFRAPDVDNEVRWGVIKLADILIRGAEEVAPKVTIHLPPTPVQETAPVLPAAAKAHAKPQKPVKVSGPPGRSPLVPFTAPKLKLGPRVGSLIEPEIWTPAPEPSTPSISIATPKPLKAKLKPQKTDKTGHIHKAQSSGMSLNDLRACRNALKKLKMSKHAALFLQPVDPVRDHAPKLVFLG